MEEGLKEVWDAIGRGAGTARRQNRAQHSERSCRPGRFQLCVLCYAVEQPS